MLLKGRCPEELGEWGRFPKFCPKGVGTEWGIFEVGRLGRTGGWGVNPEEGSAGAGAGAGCTGLGGATGATAAAAAKIVFGREAGVNL